MQALTYKTGIINDMGSLYIIYYDAVANEQKKILPENWQKLSPQTTIAIGVSIDCGGREIVISLTEAHRQLSEIDAINYCADHYKDAEHVDCLTWRVPTLQELKIIRRHRRHIDMIMTTLFGMRIKLARYWGVDADSHKMQRVFVRTGHASTSEAGLANIRPVAYL